MISTMDSHLRGHDNTATPAFVTKTWRVFQPSVFNRVVRPRCHPILNEPFQPFDMRQNGAEKEAACLARCL